MRRWIITRLSRVRFGEKNVSVDLNRIANISRLNTFESGDAAVPGIGGEDVVFAARVVELLGLGLHEHVVVRELAEVDRRLRHRQIPGGDRRQVADEQHRQALARDLVDRAEREAVAVGEGQVLVDPGGLGRLCEFSSRADSMI